jgi:hypothetical protein
MTFVDLYNEEYRNGISYCAQQLISRLMNQRPSDTDDTELVVVLNNPDRHFEYGYYLASWTKRCIFWMEELEYDFVTRSTRVCTTDSHISTSASASGYTSMVLTIPRE